MANSDSVPGRLAKIVSGGGQIPRKASPSGGRKVDDVKARLSPGEFVIPKAAVAARGPGYWASQELQAQGKPVSSKSVASAVYAPKRGGAQRFREGGESGNVGFAGPGAGDSGVSGFSGGAVGGNASGGWGSVTGGQGIGSYGSVGGDTGGAVGFGGGWGLGPASGGQGSAGSVGSGRGGSGVGGSSSGYGGGSSGGGGGSSGGAGASAGSGGVGGASSGSAGGTSGGGWGGINAAANMVVPYLPSRLGSGQASGAVVSNPDPARMYSPQQIAAANAVMASLTAKQPAIRAWGVPGVSVPSSLMGSPIGQAAAINPSLPNPSLSAEDAMALVRAASIPGITGSPIGQAAKISVPSSLTGNANAFASGVGTPSNFGQPATRGVNALAQYGIGPTMGVGMPGSAGRASPSIASLVGPRGAAAPAPAVGQPAQGRGGYAPQPIFGNRGGR